MWQLYSLLGLFSNAVENSIDKFAMVSGDALDSTIATFHRVAIYTIIIIVVGLFGWGGNLSVCLDWKIISFGIFSVLNSLLYTYALRKIEITSIGAVTYIGPVIFLCIDVFLLHTPLTTLQILGAILLVLGGAGFSIEGNTWKIKEEISLQILGILFFWIIYGGIEVYLFKFMNASAGMNPTTFFANVWAWATIGLFSLVLIERKASLLFTLDAKKYIKNSIVGKGCDVAATLFQGQALVLASASQIRAMVSLDPFMLFLVAIIAQKILKFNLNERLDKVNLIWKTGMVILLVMGGFLVR